MRWPCSLDGVLDVAFFDFRHTSAGDVFLLEGREDDARPDGWNVIAISGLVFQPVSEHSSIANSFLYHNAWSGSPSDGVEDAIDTSKTLAKESSSPQTLGLDNLINTAHGINGVGFDINGLWNAAGLSISDFVFQISPQAAFDNDKHSPPSWPAAPDPVLITIIDETSTTRALLQWTNNAIENRWLRITLKANSNTGLAQPETYYIGHLLGETTGPSNGVYTVSFEDITPIRNNVGTTVDAASGVDIDKDGTVTFADISAMRTSVGTQLTNITIPAKGED